MDTLRIGMQSIFSGAIALLGTDDHTVVGYVIGWGKNTDKKPYIVDIEPGDWGRITELETEWKKQNHYI